MPIYGSNILPVSVREYCESVGKGLDAYKLVGMHVVITDSQIPDTKMASKSPEWTEVIVGFKMIPFGSCFYLTGVALVPRIKDSDLR